MYLIEFLIQAVCVVALIGGGSRLRSSKPYYGFVSPSFWMNEVFDFVAYQIVVRSRIVQRDAQIRHSWEEGRKRPPVGFDEAFKKVQKNYVYVLAAVFVYCWISILIKFFDVTS